MSVVLPPPPASPLALAARPVPDIATARANCANPRITPFSISLPVPEKNSGSPAGFAATGGAGGCGCSSAGVSDGPFGCAVACSSDGNARGVVGIAEGGAGGIGPFGGGVWLPALIGFQPGCSSLSCSNACARAPLSKVPASGSGGGTAGIHLSQLKRWGNRSSPSFRLHLRWDHWSAEPRLSIRRCCSYRDSV